MNCAKKSIGGIIAVHIGAGYHSPSREAEYREVCSVACTKAIHVINSGGSALDAITAAIESLENAECTNAGVGSNLTLDGCVECDASMMDGKSLLFGAVGAVPEIKNPILVAKKLIDCQREESMLLGRIPPCIMVGRGASQWAKDHGILPEFEDNLKTGKEDNHIIYQFKFRPGSTKDCGVTRTTIKAGMNLNFGRIPPLTLELAALEHLKKGHIIFLFRPRTAELAALEHLKKFPETYNGENLVISLEPSILIGSSSFLQVTRKNIWCRISSKFDQIQPWTAELAALDQLKKSFTYNVLENYSKYFDDLLALSSKSTYNKHKRKLESLEERQQIKRRKHLKCSEEVAECQKDLDKSSVQDTVGAVCVDTFGNVAAGVSSGGISLKQPGRLGPAAVYGAGCWAKNVCDFLPGVAMATSGSGEHLIRTLLAKECAEHVQRGTLPAQELQTVLKFMFIESEYLKGVPEKLGGALGLKVEALGSKHLGVELLWGHTTDSFCLGYTSTKHKRPKTLISRLPDSMKAGTTVKVEGKHFVL